MMVLPEVQEIFLKYKSQEEKIDSILCSRKFPYESSGNPSFENGNVQLTLSLQQAQQRNRELMKELETVKGNLRSKAIFSPSELQWEKVSKEYASIKSLPITTWRCHLPVFV
ncbi:uncharacterized protein LOC132699703 [Cylas formicarius]|uniref:uncharacterized protein LOC132699703 n=1 Tax=Cylas formicarius TaxID=197179 RepID=UPI0029586E50|nr:uncharacterized protein LOC132699703 [Cylas formicarius]